MNKEGKSKMYRVHSFKEIKKLYSLNMEAMCSCDVIKWVKGTPVSVKWSKEKIEDWIGIYRSYQTLMECYKTVKHVEEETGVVEGVKLGLHLLDSDLGGCYPFKLPLCVKQGLYVEIIGGRVYKTRQTVLQDAEGHYYANVPVMKDIIGIDGTECDEMSKEESK